MKVLLDTHTMLWWWTAPDRISKPILDILGDPETTVLASSVSAYEMSYRHHSGKLSLPSQLLNNFAGILKEEHWTELPLHTNHSLLAGKLPSLHRDPFDRLLGAQALLEKASFVTADPMFKSFPQLTILW